MRVNDDGARRHRPTAAWTAVAAAVATVGPWRMAAGAEYAFVPRTGTAEWTTAANWTPSGAYPNAAGDVARIEGVTTTGLTVNVAAPVTVGGLYLNAGTGPYPEPLVPTVITATGTGSLTLAGGAAATARDPAGVAVIDSGGNRAATTLAADLRLAAPLRVYGSAYPGPLTLAGGLADAPGAAGNGVDFYTVPVYAAYGLSPAGRVVLTGASTLTGPVGIHTSVGLSGSAAGLSAASPVDVDAGGTLGLIGVDLTRAKPVTLTGGSLAALASAATGNPTVSRVTTPVVVRGSGRISAEGLRVDTVFTTTFYAAQLVVSGPVTGADANLSLGTGNTVVSAGAVPTVTLAGPVDLGTGTLSVPGQAYATVATADARVGRLAVAGGDLTITGQLTASTETLMDTESGYGRLHIGAGGTAGTLRTPVVRTVGNAGGYLVFNRSDAVTFDAKISGSVNLQQDGPGTTTLTGANVLATGTTVNAGTLRVAAGSSIGTGPLSVVNTANVGPGTVGTTARVVFDSAAQTVGPLSGYVSAPETGTNAVEVNLAGGTALRVNQTYGSSFAGAITGPGSLTKAGRELLGLGGPLTYAGPTVVEDGTLALYTAATDGLDVRTLAGGVTVRAGAALTLPAVVQARRTVLVTPSLSIGRAAGNALAARVDLATGDLIVRDGDLAVLTAAAADGFAGGTWTGRGLASSWAAMSQTHLPAVGVIGNADGTSPLYATFDGQPVGPGDVIARYTYYGDANLDGRVDLADYTRLDAGFLAKRTGWQNGDFNYDGAVDASDYTLADNAFNHQTGSIASPAARPAAVPEPALLGFALAAGPLSRRRPRRRHRRPAGT